MTLRVGAAEHRTEVSDAQQRPQYKQSSHSFDFDLESLEGSFRFAETVAFRQSYSLSQMAMSILNWRPTWCVKVAKWDKQALDICWARRLVDFWLIGMPFAAAQQCLCTPCCTASLALQLPLPLGALLHSCSTPSPNLQVQLQLCTAEGW